MVQSGTESVRVTIEKLDGSAIRVIVPFTPTVHALRRRILVRRWLGLCVMASLFIVAMLINPAAWFCFAPFALLFLWMGYRAYMHPNLISPFRATDVRIEATNRLFRVSWTSETRELPADAIRTIKARRCDFSRCWKLVVCGKASTGNFCVPVAIHEDSARLVEASRALREAIARHEPGPITPPSDEG